MNFNKSWVLKYFLIVFSFYCFVIVFNYKIDSMGIFGKSNDLLNAAKDIINGETIAGLKNYDERLFQELIIANNQKKNNIIVLGSSQSMLIRKKHISNKEQFDFFNHSVSGANLTDFISIIGAYKKNRNYIPANIIISIDPWIFSKYGLQTNKLSSLNKYYKFMINILNNKRTNLINDDKLGEFRKVFQLVNFDYTMSNISHLKKKINNKKNMFYKVNNTSIDDMIKEEDGSIHYPHKIRYVDPIIVKRKTKVFKIGSLERITSDDNLYNVVLFEKFINYLLINNTNITIVLPPIHPNIYKIVTKELNYNILDNVTQYIYNFSRSNGINVIGSYDPSLYGFKNADFFDGMHGHENVMKKITNEYKNNGE